MNADEWNHRYAQATADSGLVWSAAPNATVEATVSGWPAGTAIDLGAGEGRHALWLTDLGWHVTAVDFSDTGLEAGRRIAAERGMDIEWVVADVTQWSPGAPVDLVLLAYLHLPRAAFTQVVSAATQWLRPGGRLVVLGHDLSNLKHGIGGPQDPELLPDVELLRAAASPLTIDRCERLIRSVDTDSGPREAIDVLLEAHAPTT
jgi:SAM-dependent methyltransferase